jgi:H+/gluconate symporter-like permease
LLASWTQTFMGNAAGFIAQFFPLFLLGALFGKLMDDSGSVTSIAQFMTDKLGPQRAMLAVVLAGAIVTYGGVSLFVAFFVLAPMGLALFRAAGIPRRLMPAAIALGTSTFTMSAMPGTPSIQNAIPMPFFGTTPFAAPGLGILASMVMLGFGLGARRRRPPHVVSARGSGDELAPVDAVRTIQSSASAPPPRVSSTRRKCIAVNMSGWAHSSTGSPCAHRRDHSQRDMSFAILPRIDASFLEEARWGATSLSAVSGVWSVAVALLAAVLTVIAINFRRFPALRATIDAGANASVLPIVSVASLVGFGAVVAALPAFATVRDWVLAIEGGPLVSLAIATNILAALTGSASGGLTIALDALGPAYMTLAAEIGLDPALMHRVAVIGSGTLDSLPHNGAVVTLLAVCGTTHRESYLDIVMVGIVGAIAG